MEYVPVPIRENKLAQRSDSQTDSTTSPDELVLSQYISPRKTSKNNSDDEIDLAELWRAIWSGKLTIISISFIFAVASIFFALSKPDIYRASVLLSPASSEGRDGMGALAGQFGGLASLAGINLGSGGSNKTVLALEIIKSRAFLESFIAKHKLMVPLMASKSWDRTSDSLVMNEDRYNSSTKEWRSGEAESNSSKPTPWESYQKFLDTLSVVQDKKTALIKIDIEFYSPKIAKQWLTWLVIDVNNFMREQDEKEAQASIDYLIKQLEKTEVSAMETVFYQLIEEQTKNIMLTKISSEYVLKTIDPAQAPDKKSKPQRALVVVLGTMLGGILSILIVLIRYFSNK